MGSEVKEANLNHKQRLNSDKMIINLANCFIYNESISKRVNLNYKQQLNSDKMMINLVIFFTSCYHYVGVGWYKVHAMHLSALASYFNQCAYKGLGNSLLCNLYDENNDKQYVRNV